MAADETAPSMTTTSATGERTQLLDACRTGNVDLISAALADIGSHTAITLVLADCRDPATGASPLHLAAAAGSLDAVRLLLRAGHPWNSVDQRHRTAAEYARDAGHPEIWDELLAEGTRVEMVLAALEAHDQDDDEGGDDDVDDGVGDHGEVGGDPKEVHGDGVAEAPVRQSRPAPNAEYLNMRLRFEDGRILDEEANGVMMGWEAPLMAEHAAVIAPRAGLDVLNVGFGMGIIDRYLQERRPRSHTIIEAHPDVYARMLSDGWDKIDGVRILFGRWQDVLGDLETYDGIFFDTFGEFYKDLREFHENVPNLLREDGVYSYFNGLAAGNPLFHAVSCAVAEADLLDMGLRTETREIALEPLGDDVWQG
ncbi:hypothetical protein HK405_006570, partial [Cladochytrium tenue]